MSRSVMGLKANWPDKGGAAQALSGGFGPSRPHRNRYWLTPKPDPEFDTKCSDIRTVHKAAPTAAEQGVQTVWIDEMTGIQALERAVPSLPMKPGHVERRALACEVPENSNLPLSHWDQSELARDAIRRGIVETISHGSIGRFLKEADLQPHRLRGWLTPKSDPEFETKCADVCSVYREATATPNQDVRTVSIDEMTGVQALERAAPDLPMRPGEVVRREFEYVRHGTQTQIAAFDVATG